MRSFPAESMFMFRPLAVTAILAAPSPANA